MVYDIFISYRRSDGRDIARIICGEFEKRGYSVFFDYDALQDGDYGKKIKAAIESAPILVAILSNDYMSHCDNPADWVRRELETAIELKRQIIPISPDGKFNDFPALENIIGQKQVSLVDMGQLLGRCIDDIVENRVLPYISLSVTWRNLIEKNYKEAREAAKKAMKYCPDKSDTYYFAALVNLSGRSDFSHDLLERASELILKAWSIEKKLEYCYLAYCIAFLYDKRCYKQPYGLMKLAEYVQRYEEQPTLMKTLRYIIGI